MKTGRKHRAAYRELAPFEQRASAITVRRNPMVHTGHQTEDSQLLWGRRSRQRRRIGAGFGKGEAENACRNKPSGTRTAAATPVKNGFAVHCSLPPSSVCASCEMDSSVI